MNLSRKDILKYSLMPQIIPRMKDIFGTGFYHVAYFIALVYGAVRLLPANHPYVSGANIGRFGVRHVIAEAANYLIFDRHNLDKILLFFLVLLGLAIAVVQIILLGGSLFMQSAMADNFFVTPHPANDLAFMFMDMVFGVPDVFDSCVASTTASETTCAAKNGAAVTSLMALAEHGFPYPIHHALHEMLRLYSTGLMVVAVLITSYFVVTILGETAQTGTPFGKRFNKVWAPLRIVTAFALLMPIGYGLNSAQYIVLYMAKFGSSFATNGWIKFNDTLESETEKAYQSLSGGQQMLVARPQTPSSNVVSLLQFLFVAKACAEIENDGSSTTTGDENVAPYLVRNVSSATSENRIKLILDEYEQPAISYSKMHDFINGGSGQTDQRTADSYGASYATIVFGRAGAIDDAGNLIDGKKYGKYEGGVQPTCGILRFDLTDPRKPYPYQTAEGDVGNTYAEPGIDLAQRYYWNILQSIYLTNDYFFSFDDDGVGYDTVEELVKKVYGHKGDAHYPIILKDASEDISQLSFPHGAYNLFSTELKYILSIGCDEEKGYRPDQDKYGSCSALDNNFFFLEDIDPEYSVVQWQAESGSWEMDEGFRDKGWAAAGIWYNKIAELNGPVMSVAAALPEPERYPMVMEEVMRLNMKNNENVEAKDVYNPENMAGGKNLQPSSDDVQGDLKEKAVTLWVAYNLWRSVGVNSYNQPTGNLFIDTIKAIFGIEGLYNLQYNKDTHPLAQLVGVGKSLVDSSVRNIAYATVGRGAQMFFDFGKAGTAMDAAIGFMMSVTTVALTIGFMLYYVMPFLPFIYFFFAVGGWVKGIFEALVGVPLWALAHIRIDGNGLPGQAALGGYFLILEIFLRPLLTVFGLLASISIFAALVGVLSDVWVMVTSNVGGFDVRTSLSGVYLPGQEETGGVLQFMRSSIDQFFYTIVYAIVVYMIGMSSFKLIDMIPNNILRWMGQNVSAFGDTLENPAERMMGSSYFGANEVTGKVGDLLSKG